MVVVCLVGLGCLEGLRIVVLVCAKPLSTLCSHVLFMRIYALDGSLRIAGVTMGDEYRFERERLVVLVPGNQAEFDEVNDFVARYIPIVDGEE